MVKSLKTRRKEWLAGKRLTVRELAGRLSLGVGTVYKWFSESRVPRELYLAKTLDLYPDFPAK